MQSISNPLKLFIGHFRFIAVCIYSQSIEPSGFSYSPRGYRTISYPLLHCLLGSDFVPKAVPSSLLSLHGWIRFSKANHLLYDAPDQSHATFIVASCILSSSYLEYQITTLYNLTPYKLQKYYCKELN
jgi:hypothetical protein